MKTNEIDGSPLLDFPLCIERRDAWTIQISNVTPLDSEECEAMLLKMWKQHATLLAVAEAARAMLGNYRELKQISLAMARSDAPNWIGAGMTVESDIHVQAVTSALAALDKLTKVSVDKKQSTGLESGHGKQNKRRQLDNTAKDKMKTTTYNGHKNWAHWNVSLWISNDESLYRSAINAIRVARRDNRPDPLKSAARHLLQYLGDKTPDGARYNFTNVRAALSGLE